ncbi:MAG: pyridoxamine 5'-phosphate oxidase family protein [Prevotellaceae bacterium]|jgi:uncharacterized pyridoxamine 5'-phosphate oxidase family protein|nr:pyridoxamine 5'-phosphate oxidase family protein [Prevotellaceae bacterium]
MEEVYQFLKKCRVFFIATTDGDRPQVRPFSAVDLFEGRLYLQTGYPKKVSQQIAANPHVAICAFDGHSWLRISTTLVEDPRLEAKQHMIDNNEELQARGYTAEGDYTEVLYMTHTTATIASHDSAPQLFEF